MPELPEVETTLRGIEPYILNKKIKKVIIRHYQLRWPIPHNIQEILVGKTIKRLERRAKYLLFKTSKGTLILHLGMSGSIRILTEPCLPNKHDHVDLEFPNNIILRFTDPRRFGALLWTEDTITSHPLLKHLGPEPLEKEFSNAYLHQIMQNKNTPIKSFIMDNKNVVGVGNIYATEALFLAKIHPKTPAKNISSQQSTLLVKIIKQILRLAIKKGGTTLKDFVNSKGNPGYFSQHLKVYGRAGEPCLECNLILDSFKIGQRSTVYCGNCQH